MNSYWITFDNHAPGCVDATDSVEAAAFGDAIGLVNTIKILPYPAEPRLVRRSACPSFCLHPKECAGLTSCPRRHACSD
jgi:hypothetical protein